MREIKFRAWDKDKSKMFGVFGFDVNHIRAWLVTDQAKIDFAIPPHRRDCVLMQFAGLRDSKRTNEYPEGQEIYEGDILKAWKHSETLFIHEVKHRSGILWFGNWNWIEFQNVFRNIEVIGNIYEHPHLLAMEDKA